jgi:Mg-chelatase subunit ChlD
MSRLFLAAIPSICAAATTKGSLLPSSIVRYADPATDLPVFRLTNPEHASVLPPHYARSVSRKGNFLVYSSDVSGSMQGPSIQQARNALKFVLDRLDPRDRFGLA